MRIVRSSLAFLLVVGFSLTMSSTRAQACTCLGDPVQAADLGVTPDLVFTGTVVGSGVSNVTAEWSRPPQPGLALLFAVEEVRLGEIGARVVVHTPGGTPGRGNCSVGVVTGLQLVTANRDSEGFLRGGMCSIHPMMAGSPEPAALTETFGPARQPSPDIAPQTLTAGVALPPDPEDLGAQQVFDELGGELDFSADGGVESTSSSAARIWIAGVAIGASGAIALLLRRRRAQRLDNGNTKLQP